MTYLISTDECGWGCIAGPLFVCGVRALTDWKIDGLNDSKKLSPKRRQIMHDRLMECVEQKEITYHIAQRSNVEIDTMGCYAALKDAHIEAFKMLGDAKTPIIVDGNLRFNGLGMDDWQIKSVIKADASVPICMAASIIGKYRRDMLMAKLGKEYPQYGWDGNWGYPTADHKEALEKFGITPLHRKSYRPVKDMLLAPHNLIKDTL